MGMVFDPLTGQWYPTSSTPVPGTVRLVVTVSQAMGGRDGGSRESERVQAVETLYGIANALVSTQSLTGSVTGRNGVFAGSWTYTPTAVS